MVIGADGHRSIVRNFVAPEVDEGSDTNHSFYTYVIFWRSFRSGSFFCLVPLTSSTPGYTIFRLCFANLGKPFDLF